MVFSLPVNPCYYANEMKPAISNDIIRRCFLNPDIHPF